MEFKNPGVMCFFGAQPAACAWAVRGGLAARLSRPRFLSTCQGQEGSFLTVP